MQAGTLRKDAGIEPISYNSFIQTYNTQKRIPVMMYKQLAKIAKKTTTKILRKRGGPKTDEYVEKCVRFFERSSLPRMKTYLVRSVYCICPGLYYYMYCTEQCMLFILTRRTPLLVHCIP